MPADPTVVDMDMSHNDRLFVALYLEGGRVTEAAIEAYQVPDPIKAGRIGNAALKRFPEVFAMMMDREGLTDKDLIRRLLEGLDAQKTKFATHQGLITDERQVIDHQTRAIYQRIALDLKGHTPNATLTLQDDAGRPLGPVILPVREGAPLHIQDAEVVEPTGGVPREQGLREHIHEGSNASPVAPSDGEGEKVDEGGEKGDWD